MIARMLARLAVRLAFELLDNKAHDVRIIDLFAVAIHDPPATLDLEGEASQRALVCDLRVVVLVRDPVRWMATLIVGDMDDVLYGVIDEHVLNGTVIWLV